MKDFVRFISGAPACIVFSVHFSYPCFIVALSFWKRFHSSRKGLKIWVSRSDSPYIVLYYIFIILCTHCGAESFDFFQVPVHNQKQAINFNLVVQRMIIAKYSVFLKLNERMKIHFLFILITLKIYLKKYFWLKNCLFIIIIHSV